MRQGLRAFCALAGLALAALAAACVLDAAGQGSLAGAGAAGSGGAPSVGAGDAGEGGGGGGGATTTSSGMGGAPNIGGSGGMGGSGGEPPVEPACGDGQVQGAEQCDDGNTASGDGCAANCVYEPVANGCPTVAMHVGAAPITITGNTQGAADDDDCSDGGSSAGDVIFLVQAAVNGTFQATVSSDMFSEVLWIRATCPGGTQLDCDDNDPADVSLAVTAGQTFFLGVDGNGGQTGPFSLTMVIGP